jgi:hypothetical protein
MQWLERQGKDELKAIDFYLRVCPAVWWFVFCLCFSLQQCTCVHQPFGISMSWMKVRRGFVRRCTFLGLKCVYNYVLAKSKKLENVLCVEGIGKVKRVLCNTSCVFSTLLMFSVSGSIAESLYPAVVGAVSFEQIILPCNHRVKGLYLFGF